MPKRKNQPKPAIRTILPIRSVGASGGVAVFIPAGGRLFQVKGEADTKETIDFYVTLTTWNGAATTTNMKFCGAEPGQTVSLLSRFPNMTTIGSVPVAVGDVAVSVLPGTGVTLQVYYLFGNVT